MPYIAPRGNPSAPIWVLCEAPFSTDIAKEYCFSGGMGYAFYNMLHEANIAEDDVYVIARKPDTDNINACSVLEQKIEQYKPPLLLTVGEACEYWVNECSKDWRTQINKYVGSLLRSPKLNYAHYIMPLIPMERLMADWGERNVTTYIDLGKVRCELDFYRQNAHLQALPQRILIANELSTQEIINRLRAFHFSDTISCDIETIYPRKGSEYYRKHPGEPIVLGIAISPSYALSFSLWRESIEECIALWQAIQSLYNKVNVIIGQNFFNFDALFLNMIGLRLDRAKFQDTLIRHHILWPELSHKLQFLTRQYTREPYYKDEGKGWNRKDLTGLRRYNALDCAVTFEVYLEQEKEFNQRPELRGEVA